MFKYSMRRIVWLVPTVLGVLIFLFSLTYLLPGEPADIILGNRATPEMVEQLNNRLGLNQPWPISLVKYIGGVFKGDWGKSIFREIPVLKLLKQV